MCYFVGLKHREEGARWHFEQGAWWCSDVSSFLSSDWPWVVLKWWSGNLGQLSLSGIKVGKEKKSVVPAVSPRAGCSQSFRLWLKINERWRSDVRIKLLSQALGEGKSLIWRRYVFHILYLHLGICQTLSVTYIMTYLMVSVHGQGQTIYNGVAKLDPVGLAN